MSNKSLPASPPGVGLAEGQGSHLLLSGSHLSARSGGGEQILALRNSIRPLRIPLSPGFRSEYVCASECLRPVLSSLPRPAPGLWREQQFLGPGGSGALAVRPCLLPQHVTATFRRGLGWAWSPRPCTPRGASAAQQAGPGSGDPQKEQELYLLCFSKWKIREMRYKTILLRVC